MTFLILRRLFLAYVALEDLLAGTWLLARPEEMFRLLEIRPRDLLLWRGLGLLLLAHVPCLALAGWRPRRWRSLVLVPLVGRTLLAGLWIWLLFSERVSLPAPVLRILLGVELVWLPGLAWTLRPCSDQQSECGE